VIDTIEYCTQHMPQWNTVSISGYHIREAGATAPQELAFTIADGMCYVEESHQARPRHRTRSLPRLSFFWDVHNEFFEEIAKLRAARRMWARIMRDRYGAKNERSWWLRCHCQTAGVSLTEQQPMVNIIRVAYQALAAVLGGTQSLHTNSMDETLALPTENAVKIALRTQQVIAEETGVTRTVDPLGGSYFIESLTDEIESAGARDHRPHLRPVRRRAARDRAGLFPPADRRFVGPLRRGVRSRRADHDRREQARRGRLQRIPILKIDEQVEREQVDRVKTLKQRRDAKRHEATLAALRKAALDEENVMPYLVDAAEAHATVGEMMETLKGVYANTTAAPSCSVRSRCRVGWASCPTNRRHRAATLDATPRR
jgi:methylmalonyl-CoA mutase N-terminal domain/subunit